MKKTFLTFAVLSLGLSSISYSRTSYETYPVVKKGGNYNDLISITPQTLNPMLISDVESREVSENLYLPLMGTDGETYETYPALALKLQVSKDKKDYSFELNPAARWADGTPVTSDDVEFTFNRVMDPKIEAAPLRGYYVGIVFTKIDALKFKFHIDTPRYNTLEFISGFTPIQKKQFEKEADFNKSRENLHPVGSSAYKVKSLSRDQSVVLERIPNWWGKDLPQFKARYNFDTITFKIIADPALTYEKFIKSEVDGIRLTSDQFVNQVNGIDKARFGKSPADGKPLWANKLPTDGPMGWSGIALNLKNPILSSLETRKGLAYLVDYQMILDKAFLGTAEQSVSPFGSNTENTDPALKKKENRYHYDAKKAAELFKKDGWIHSDGESFLVKTINGKKTPFHLVIKYPPTNPTITKAVIMLKEIFKKQGVDLELKPTDGTALYTDFENKNFEALTMGWGAGGLYPDVKQLWSSESIEQGSNKTSYSNPKVDALIKKADVEFDRKKRAKMVQEIGKIIYDEVPYIFLVERHFLLHALNSRIKSPKWVERYGSSLAKDLFHE